MQQKVRLELTLNGGENLCVKGVALVDNQLLVFTEIVRWNGLCITDPYRDVCELIVDTGDAVYQDKPVKFYVVTGENQGQYEVKNLHANAINNVTQVPSYDDLLNDYQIDVAALKSTHGVTYYEKVPGVEAALRHSKNEIYGYLCDEQNNSYNQKKEYEKTISKDRRKAIAFISGMLVANIGFFALKAWTASQSPSSSSCKPCPPCDWHPD